MERIKQAPPTAVDPGEVDAILADETWQSATLQGEPRRRADRFTLQQ